MVEAAAGRAPSCGRGLLGRSHLTAAVSAAARCTEQHACARRSRARRAAAAAFVAQATAALRITAPELVKFGVMDEIVPEPLGGAHADPVSAFPMIKESILKVYSS